MDRKDAKTKGRHIKEANKEKKSAEGNLLNYPYFHHSILFLHINIEQSGKNLVLNTL